MKIVGLITEYNPFHKGHEFHIAKSLELSGADCAIVVMSGDFVQRGTPAIMPKHLRTEMALKGGASIVLELPLCYATASAEFFAMGAVELLDSLGCVDSICFGSECGDLDSLSLIAHVLLEEPEEYKQSLQSYLSQGISYPKAREEALISYGAEHNLDASIISKPNNILGIEYLKALNSLGSSMKSYTIARNTSQYHDEQLGPVHSSATALRESLLEGTSWDVLESHVSKDSLAILQEHYQKNYPLVMDDFSLLLRYKLLITNIDELMNYADLSPDLARRIYKLRYDFSSISQFTELIKTKNYTYSRISRCLLHILLGVKEQLYTNTDKYNHYIRVLGFKKDRQSLLTAITNSSQLPLLTKLKDLEILSSKGQEMIAVDIASSNLFEMQLSHKFKRDFIPEQSKSMIIL